MHYIASRSGSCTHASGAGGARLVCQLCPTVRANARNRPAGNGKVNTQRGSRPFKQERVVADRVALDFEVSLSPDEGMSLVKRSLMGLIDSKARMRAILQHARALPAFPEEERTLANRVMGCTAQVWLLADLDSSGCVQFQVDSDSEVTKGIAALMVEALSGCTPADVRKVDSAQLDFLDLGFATATPSRTNPAMNLLEAMKKHCAALEGDLPLFPSLLISADEIVPQGAFAEAQATYLHPDAATVERLVKLLSEKRIGVVAHFYMDPQVQGVLSAAAESWPHVHISDSLVMADSAVAMAKAGCKAVLVLGVDFMSENVRAILDEAGYTDVQVYRMAEADIGCSLAVAAETEAYFGYLDEAALRGEPALHVVYINTSLRTKALAHAAVPTITCTSSNVVQTVLQAFAQVPDIHVYYGPDTYMGRNLAYLLTALSTCTDEEVKEVHPAHTAASIKAALPRLHYYQDGTCIVHHMFGGEVTEMVRTAYGDAYLAAHFEVPGEMFIMAMEAKKQRGMGVVGSTQNILDFICDKLRDAIGRPFPEHLKLVLGTESGMITSIVRRVQAMLKDAQRSDIKVEVVFPVAADAITTERQSGEVSLPGGLALVPGPAGGEGCSSEGGCAACPYMKMNSLSALLEVCGRVATPAEFLLEGYKPKAYAELVNGQTMAAAGCQPILHMRSFQSTKKLSPALEEDILGRAGHRA